AEDLLASVFPAQLGCQDNAVGPIEIPDHPLVKETLRDCLTEAMDAQGLKRCLEALFSGKIRRVARETPEPSVFAHEILNANPYAYLDDAPLEERRARAVTLRRGRPAELADDVGRLEPEAIAAVVEMIRARLGLLGPVTAAALAAPLGLTVGDVNSAVAQIEAEGGVLRGRFSPDLASDAIEWCDRRLLARIHRRTLDRLRREIE